MTSSSETDDKSWDVQSQPSSARSSSSESDDEYASPGGVHQTLNSPQPLIFSEKNNRFLVQHSTLIVLDRNIITINIPSNVHFLSDSCFANCARLREVSLPEGIQVLSRYCFKYCVSLQKVHLPSTLQSFSPAT